MDTTEIVAFLLVGALVASALVTRDLVISRRVRMHTQAQISGLAGLIPPNPDVGSPAAEVRQLLDQAGLMLARDEHWFMRAVRAVVWTGSPDLAAFELIHQAKVTALQAPEIRPPSQIRAMIHAAHHHVDELPPEDQKEWHSELKRLEKAHIDAQRAGLAEFKRELYAARDDYFGAINGLQNKTTWLVGASALAILVLVIDGFAEVLLAGGVGGLVSRAHRVITRSTAAPTDYGLSWAPIFIAPTLGALAGWAGVEVLNSLHALNVVGLGDLFPTAHDPVREPTHAILGLAVVFGFSERFFERVSDITEESIKSGLPKRQAPTQTQG